MYDGIEIFDFSGKSFDQFWKSDKLEVISLIKIDILTRNGNRQASVFALKINFTV
jgi:hypothetical protein